MAHLLECGNVRAEPRSTTPWLLVAASVLLVVVVLYLLFAAYLPAKRRVARLEAELREVYAREAQLQTRLNREDQRSAQREQQIAAFTAEREALSRKVDELEKEIAAAKAPRRRR